jgi:hypothetical protein
LVFFPGTREVGITAVTAPHRGVAAPVVVVLEWCNTAVVVVARRGRAATLVEYRAAVATALLVVVRMRIRRATQAAQSWAVVQVGALLGLLLLWVEAEVVADVVVGIRRGEVVVVVEAVAVIVAVEGDRNVVWMH